MEKAYPGSPTVKHTKPFGGMDFFKHTVGSKSKGSKLSAAHRKAISEGLKNIINQVKARDANCR